MNISFPQKIMIVNQLLQVFYLVSKFNRHNDGVFDFFDGAEGFNNDKEQKVDINLRNVAAVFDVVSEIVGNIEQ